MKYTLLFLFFAALNGRTQPFLDKSLPFNIQIRAKYLPFGFLEDLYWRGYNYGIGCTVYDRITLGVDGHVFRTKWQNDEAEDVQYGIPVYDDIYRRTSIYSDLQVKIIKRDNFEVFVQSYARFKGRYWEYNKESRYNTIHPLPNYMNNRARGNFQDIGVGAGCKLYFTSNIGFEASLNVAQRNETTEYHAYDEQNNVSITLKTNESPVVWLRSTLFIQLKGKESVQ